MKNILSYRADIDGLRAIAVLGVLLFHLNAAWLPGGFAGVDIFFVISGYLITNIILKEMNEGQFSFIRFYERRTRRIFPALFIMLVILTPLAWSMLYLEAFINYIGDFKYAAAQIANFHFAKDVDYFQTDAELSPLLHTWSLGVEEQFYIIWPLALFLVYKFSKTNNPVPLFIVLGAGSLALSEFFLRYPGGQLLDFADNINQAFYMIYCRAYQLIIGGMLALSFFKDRALSERSTQILAWAGAALIIYSYCFLNKQTIYPGLSGLIPALGAAALIMAHQNGRNSLISQALSLRPVVFIGLISYSLYLWHWPIIKLYETYTQYKIDIPAALALSALSFLCAWLSYLFAEKPFRQYTKPMPNGRIWVIAAGIAVIVCFAVFSNATKSHLESLTNRHLGFVFPQADVDTENSKIYGWDQDHAPIILTGDSHAAAMLDGVIAWAEKEKDLPVQFISRQACQMFGSWDQMIWPKEKCENVHNRLQQRMADTDHPVQYLILVQRYDGLMIDVAADFVSDQRAQDLYDMNGPKMLAALDDSIRNWSAAFPDIQIVLIGQVPKLKVTPHHCLQRDQLFMNKIVGKPFDCIPSEIDERISKIMVNPFNRALKNLAKQYENVVFFDSNRPFPPDQSESWWQYYRDHNHITKEGALYVSDFFDF